MKKTILALALFVFAGSAFAQDGDKKASCCKDKSPSCCKEKTAACTTTTDSKAAKADTKVDAKKTSTKKSA